jgi:hypothetical protein
VKLAQVRFIAFLLALSPAISFAQSEEISEEQMLEFIADGLATCSDVKKVERESTDFRVYDRLSAIMYEFSLDDARADRNKYSDNRFLQLRCGPPGCISMFQPAIGTSGWRVTRKLNSMIWECHDGMARRLSIVIRGHRKLYLK